MVLGKGRAETALAAAALYCAGARLVASRPDLMLLVHAKAAAPRRHTPGVPFIAIVPRRQKTSVLAAGADAAYSRPLRWKAYRRLVARVLTQWTPARR